MVFADIKYSSINYVKEKIRRKNADNKEHRVANALGFIEMVLICLYEKRQKRQVSITIE